MPGRPPPRVLRPPDSSSAARAPVRNPRARLRGGPPAGAQHGDETRRAQPPIANARGRLGRSADRPGVRAPEGPAPQAHDGAARADLAPGPAGARPEAAAAHTPVRESGEGPLHEPALEPEPLAVLTQDQARRAVQAVAAQTQAGAEPLTGLDRIEALLGARSADESQAPEPVAPGVNLGLALAGARPEAAAQPEVEGVGEDGASSGPAGPGSPAPGEQAVRVASLSGWAAGAAPGLTGVSTIDPRASEHFRAPTSAERAAAATRNAVVMQYVTRTAASGFGALTLAREGLDLALRAGEAVGEGVEHVYDRVSAGDWEGLAEDWEAHTVASLANAEVARERIMQRQAEQLAQSVADLDATVGRIGDHLQAVHALVEPVVRREAGALFTAASRRFDEVSAGVEANLREAHENLVEVGKTLSQVDDELLDAGARWWAGAEGWVDARGEDFDETWAWLEDPQGARAYFRDRARELAGVPSALGRMWTTAGELIEQAPDEVEQWLDEDGPQRTLDAVGRGAAQFLDDLSDAAVQVGEGVVGASQAAYAASLAGGRQAADGLVWLGETGRAVGAGIGANLEQARENFAGAAGETLAVTANVGLGMLQTTIGTFAGVASGSLGFVVADAHALEVAAARLRAGEPIGPGRRATLEERYTHFAFAVRTAAALTDDEEIAEGLRLRAGLSGAPPGLAGDELLAWRLDRMAECLRAQAADLLRDVEDVRQLDVGYEPSTHWAWRYLEMTVVSLPYLAMSLNPVGRGILGISAAGQVLERRVEHAGGIEHVDTEDVLWSWGAGAVHTVLNRFGSQRMLGRPSGVVGAQGAKVSVWQAARTEGNTEALQGVTEVLASHLGTDESTLRALWDESPDLFDQFAVGFLSGGLVRGGGQIVLRNRDGSQTVVVGPEAIARAEQAVRDGGGQPPGVAGEALDAGEVAAAREAYLRSREDLRQAGANGDPERVVQKLREAGSDAASSPDASRRAAARDVQGEQSGLGALAAHHRSEQAAHALARADRIAVGADPGAEPLTGIDVAVARAEVERAAARDAAVMRNAPDHSAVVEPEHTSDVGTSPAYDAAVLARAPDHSAVVEPQHTPDPGTSPAYDAAVLRSAPDHSTAVESEHTSGVGTGAAYDAAVLARAPDHSAVVEPQHTPDPGTSPAYDAAVLRSAPDHSTAVESEHTSGVGTGAAYDAAVLARAPSHSTVVEPQHAPDAGTSAAYDAAVLARASDHSTVAEPGHTSDAGTNPAYDAAVLARAPDHSTVAEPQHVLDTGASPAYDAAVLARASDHSTVAEPGRTPDVGTSAVYDAAVLDRAPDHGSVAESEHASEVRTSAAYDAAALARVPDHSTVVEADHTPDTGTSSAYDAAVLARAPDHSAVVEPQHRSDVEATSPAYDAAVLARAPDHSTVAEPEHSPDVGTSAAYDAAIGVVARARAEAEGRRVAAGADSMADPLAGLDATAAKAKAEIEGLRIAASADLGADPLAGLDAAAAKARSEAGALRIAARTDPGAELLAGLDATVAKVEAETEGLRIAAGADPATDPLAGLDAAAARAEAETRGLQVAARADPGAEPLSGLDATVAKARADTGVEARQSRAARVEQDGAHEEGLRESRAARAEQDTGAEARQSRAARVEQDGAYEEGFRQSRAARAEQDTGAEARQARAARVEQDTGADVRRSRAARAEQDTGVEVRQARAARAEQDTGVEARQARAARVEQDTSADVRQSRAARAEQDSAHGEGLRQARAARAEQDPGAELRQSRVARVEQDGAYEEGLRQARAVRVEQDTGAELRQSRSARAEQDTGADLRQARAARAERDTGADLRQARAVRVEQDTGAELRQSRAARAEQDTGADLRQARAERAEQDTGVDLRQSRAARVEQDGAYEEGLRQARAARAAQDTGADLRQARAERAEQDTGVDLRQSRAARVEQDGAYEEGLRQARAARAAQDTGADLRQARAARAEQDTGAELRQSRAARVEQDGAYEEGLRQARAARAAQDTGADLRQARAERAEQDTGVDLRQSRAARVEQDGAYEEGLRQARAARAAQDTGADLRQARAARAEQDTGAELRQSRAARVEQDGAYEEGLRQARAARAEQDTGADLRQSRVARVEQDGAYEEGLRQARAVRVEQDTGADLRQSRAARSEQDPGAEAHQSRPARVEQYRGSTPAPGSIRAGGSDVEPGATAGALADPGGRFRTEQETKAAKVAAEKLVGKSVDPEQIASLAQAHLRVVSPSRGNGPGNGADGRAAGPAAEPRQSPEGKGSQTQDESDPQAETEAESENRSGGFRRMAVGRALMQGVRLADDVAQWLARLAQAMLEIVALASAAGISAGVKAQSSRGAEVGRDARALREQAAGTARAMRGGGGRAAASKRSAAAPASSSAARRKRKSERGARAR